MPIDDIERDSGFTFFVSVPLARLTIAGADPLWSMSDLEKFESLLNKRKAACAFENVCILTLFTGTSRFSPDDMMELEPEEPLEGEPIHQFVMQSNS